MKLPHTDDFLKPSVRLQIIKDRPVSIAAEFVVYWMTTQRRALELRLAARCRLADELHRPLVIVKLLSCGGRWDCDRFHRFTLDGMAENARHLARRAVLYHPYIETKPGEARKFLRTLAERACLVVTDDYPIVLPAVQSADFRAKVRIEAVDGNGLLPLRVAEKPYVTARSFRRFLQANLREYLFDAPRPDPLVGRRLPRLASLPADISSRWPAADTKQLSDDFDLADLPIQHRIVPVALRGGPIAAKTVWQRFLNGNLARYAVDRNQPDADGSSGLSPYLHFGQISAHEIVFDLLAAENWNPERLAERPTGKNEGWWGVGPNTEAFLDQIVTWRELGLNACLRLPEFDTYDSLPDWARATLAKHAVDRRPEIYTLDELSAAATHDELWNAAQRQLLREGRIHNYLRMLWGKKILQWSATPRQAWDALIELNNRYALDGQDPNSYSGIAWIFGRYDRPWGPERPIFGHIRYMTCESAVRKLRLRNYLQKYA